METLFLLFAAVGGTVMVLQFLLLLTGMGGHAGDGADLSDVALDVELPGDVDVSSGGDALLDATVELPDHGEVSATHGHGSSHLFEILSLRSVVAAITFFGLGGLFGERSGASPIVTLAIALMAGGGALSGVYYMMRALYRMRHDGTIRIRRAVGREGTVYIPIPPRQTGVGKVQLHVQQRVMEFKAVTEGADRLPTGQRIDVVDVVDQETVLVEPIRLPQPLRATARQTNSP